MIMQTILVTGATGRVGSRFVPRLLQREYTVRLLVRRAEQAEAFRKLGAEVIVGDLSQKDCLASAVAGVQTVVHLAAYFRGTDQERIRTTNEEGALSLANAALSAGVERFVFTSTNTVYGPGHSRPAREDDPLRPAITYPQTKVAAEQALLELYRTRGLGVRILRLAFVYGEGDPHVTDFLPVVGQQLQWHPAKRLHMVHHADVSQALLRALATPGIDGQIYNVADDAPISLAELRRLNGLPEGASDAVASINDPWEMIVDTLRIRDQLGFRPIYPSYYAARDAGAL
jgi:nucleoside-diphosphate-sugar epimerase